MHIQLSFAWWDCRHTKTHYLHSLSALNGELCSFDVVMYILCRIKMFAGCCFNLLDFMYNILSYKIDSL